ncbi:hypothetical protein [Chitinophaga sp. CF118]|uniref:hypothetical protein n=1 Tax=Chitinophaga sp. CF118 TaxID=1884367 RepID=UPI001160817F|nr:hypothetical protein [Chitinophaga sp. CF118]
MFFELDGKTYSKAITRGKRDQLNIGDSIKLKYSPEVKSHFLFPDENPTYVGYALIFGVLFMSIGLFYYAFKK